MMILRIVLPICLALSATPVLAQGKSADAPGQSQGNNADPPGQSNGNSYNTPGQSQGNSANAPGQSQGNSANAPGQSQGNGGGASAPSTENSLTPDIRSGASTGTSGPPAGHSGAGPNAGATGDLPGTNPKADAGVMQAPAAPATGEAGTPAGPVVSLSSDQVRDAVSARQALSLAEMNGVLSQRGGGEIVDASLLRVNGMLVYALRVINPQGRLSIEYFHARSGVYIGSE